MALSSLGSYMPVAPSNAKPNWLWTMPGTSAVPKPSELCEKRTTAKMAYSKEMLI